ncbi:MFS transporter [Pseudomonas sp. G11-1]|uniref:Metabolite-proton symporter n=1 Tax=Halopseudomonas bauzanensis TaxID=653930 RepID=A0A031MGS4_9GAMM|nr:MFS transporter [Halopseudomonas bauzanensis]MCO5785043.1 MFS transporter [Pseudomonas sp. G11-1]MCO5788854.1 MFS transporter [Pseudomonas sp. G11-2]EZQ19195.1 major facilitator transporter [Halopseudomonas bauzanensis]SER57763.1 metabolite-proton symporter [Halopseudomonas bauzanensis]SFL67547.1 metabolite-proton symporter [Halopseudomonas bauzanensis]
MSNTSATQTPANSRSRVMLASLVGTTIEFYDFYVYATAAVLVFPHLFFPPGNETTALLASFAIFGAAMIARPLGAVFFGHLGDKVGRKTTLIYALLTMGIATFLIGLLPTYHAIGWFAPLMLVILRLAQGFAIGGEWSGAALVATENAPAGKRALFGTFPQLGAPLGFIIANGLFLIVAAALPSDNPSRPSEAFLDWGWRIPFLFSAVMVIIGLWIRLNLVESTTFSKAVSAGKVVKLPLGEVVRKNWRELILGTFYMLATYVLFYLMTTFSLSYGRAPIEPGPGQLSGLGYSYNNFVLMLIIGVVFFGIFTLLSGPWADKLGRRKTLILVTLGIIIFSLLWVPLLNMGFVGVMAWLILGFSLMGMTFGPMGALLPELFPTNVRYTGSGISYNVSSILGAAVAPFIAVWLWGMGDGSPFLVGIYLASMAVITLLALIVGKETKNIDIDR